MIAQQQQEFADQVEQREQLAKRHKEEIAELLQQVDAVYLFIFFILFNKIEYGHIVVACGTLGGAKRSQTPERAARADGRRPFKGTPNSADRVPRQATATRAGEIRPSQEARQLWQLVRGPYRLQRRSSASSSASCPTAGRRRTPTPGATPATDGRRTAGTRTWFFIIFILRNNVYPLSLAPATWNRRRSCCSLQKGDQAKGPPQGNLFAVTCLFSLTSFALAIQLDQDSKRQDRRHDLENHLGRGRQGQRQRARVALRQSRIDKARSRACRWCCCCPFCGGRCCSQEASHRHAAGDEPRQQHCHHARSSQAAQQRDQEGDPDP